MKTSKNIRLLLISTLLVFFNLNYAAFGASQGRELFVKQGCPECHNITGPAVTTIPEILKKNGPDLFYAGSKFQKGFLIDFLQKAEQIRPAGTVYLNNIKYDEWKDELNPVKPCPVKLSKEDAMVMAEFLMSLKSSTLKHGLYKPEKFSIAKAKIIFEKNLACYACHKVRNDKGSIEGGVSGTILYNAGSRLNGDWVYNFLQNPQNWIPRIWMPRIKGDEETVQLMTNYIMSMTQ